LTPGAAGCTGCNRRVPNPSSVRPRQALAPQRPRSLVTRQPTVALATRGASSSPNQTLPPPAEWVAPAAEVIEVAEVAEVTPPPIAIQPPAFYAPPPTTKPASDRSSGRKAFRPVVWAFGIFVVLFVIGTIDNAVQKSSTNDVNVSVPSIKITLPSFVPPKAPTLAIPVNVMPNLVTLGAADEIYRVEHGSYTNNINVLNRKQFSVDPRGDYEVGVNSLGYCVIGRESADVWRLYDKNNPANIVSTYADKTAAMKACSLDVHWG
jgi:hypothetical protein